MIFSIANLVYELLHELPNNLRLRILENREILGKSPIWVETWPSAQSPFQKLNFGSSSHKTRKSRYQTLLALSSFTGFHYFLPNILFRIVGLDVIYKCFESFIKNILKVTFFNFMISYRAMNSLFIIKTHSTHVVSL